MVPVLGLPSKSPGKLKKKKKKHLKKLLGLHVLKFSFSMSGVRPEN